MAHAGGVGAGILIDDSDCNVARVLVGIPVGDDVEPCIERRQDADTECHDDGSRVMNEPLEITEEDSENGLQEGLQ